MTTDIQDKREDDHKPVRSRPQDSKILTGVFFLIIGGLLLANKMDAGIPNWIFTWPCILIAVGVYSAFKDRLTNNWWIIFIVVGTLFLINNEFVDLNLQEYMWPIIFIAVGLMFLTRPRHRWHNDEFWDKRRFKERYKRRWDRWERCNTSDSVNSSDAEVIEINSVFGSAKKIIFSKNFKGGEINCFMGGAEVDLMQADIQGPVFIEANQVFGGTKIKIPAHWDLKTEITSVFGGIEDKRHSLNATQIDPTKVLVLKGASIFAGIEIRNY